MRLMLRWLGRGLAALLTLLVLAMLGAVGLVWSTLPRSGGEAALPGLAAPVHVAFDSHGVPRIRASDEADAWRALGYLHARDRLFQMETMRRGATGRLAEIAGASALRLDRYMRLLDLERRAAADFAILPPEARATLEAYAEGVNAWIAARGRFAAPEFLALGAPEPWRPVDSLLWGKVMSLWLSGNWRIELDRARLLATLPPERLADLWPQDRTPGRPDRPDLRAEDSAARDAPFAPTDVDVAALERLGPLLPRFPEDAPLPSTASNSWAVAPARSASGGALLATDPHLGFGAPILWYLARIELPGGRFLAGATAPGVPGVVIGRNERIAWGFTTTHADAQDVVLERLAGPDAYVTPEGPVPFTVREAVIRVRGADPVLLRLRETRHGPVVSDLDTSPPRADAPVVALALAGLAPGGTSAAGLLALNRAGSIAEARAAAMLITSPPQNLMVVDQAGGMAMYLTGRIPVRRSGDGSLPVRGWEGGPAWTGFVPFEALPHVENPASGVLANANNRVSPPGHPVLLARDWPGDWRFRRIGDMLGARTTHDADSFAAMQNDVVSAFAAEALPAFRALSRPEGTAGAALDLLLAWDGAMAADRPQPLIFHATLRRFGRAVLEAGGVRRGAWEPTPEFLRHVLHTDGRGAPWCGAEGCPARLSAALVEAVAALAAEHGPDPAHWRWGPSHVARFEHALLRYVPGLAPLTRLATASAGDGETLLRAGFRGDGPSFANVHGAGFRGVFDMADPAGARAIIATGQSGHPMSRHWSDQLPLWRDGGLLTLGPLPEGQGVRLRLRPGG